MKNRTRRGAALMLALWLLVALAAIATRVVWSARSRIAIASNLRASLTAKYAAESGIEMTLAMLRDSLATTGAARADFLARITADGALADTISLGDGRVQVAIVDVNARIDVNNAAESVLRGLFANFGDFARASSTARAIRLWVDPLGTGGGGSARADSLGRFVPRAARVLRSLQELTLVPGVDEEIVRAAAPYLTVDGDGIINRRGAPEIVRSVATGEMRDQPTRLLLVSRGWYQGHPLTREIQSVYAITGSDLILVAWRERDL